MKRAVFLDRDGVLNVYLPGAYVRTPDELIPLPEIGDAVARLRAAGYFIALISNQQGVGKGVMSAADLDAVTAKLGEAVALDAIYYCTARESENSFERKPNPGMILRAAREHDLDLAASVFVGDTEDDAKAARAAGVGTFILALTGRRRQTDVALFTPPPDYLAAGLSEAADWILQN